MREKGGSTLTYLNITREVLKLELGVVKESSTSASILDFPQVIQVVIAIIRKP